MSDLILYTKLFIPPVRPNLVPRPHLITRLNQGLRQGHKLTLISAPAGSGKTTLVAEWASSQLQVARGKVQGASGELRVASVNETRHSQTVGSPLAFCWLSLDEGDGEPRRFLTYLVTALQTLALSPVEGRALSEKSSSKIGAEVAAALQSPQSPPIEALLTVLLNELTAVAQNFLLVLDDYHLIDAPAVDEVLAFLLERLPPQMHLVITTREDPQLPLARLRARGQMTELRSSDLRFSPQEAAAFLNQVMGLDLPAAEVAALEERTEGWIAGLQLAALSMQGREDLHGFISAFTGDNRYIVDYLAEEVLQRRPDYVRSFLLQTSILQRLSGPLCAAVTGYEEAGALLEALERSNLFVIPLDDKRRWYRYHHLFADVLEAHLLAEQPELIPALHQRACAWCEANDMPSAAIHHALAGENFEFAAGLIEQVWPEMNRHFQDDIWLAWVRALPQELICTRPVLSASYTWALLQKGDLETAEVSLRDAESWLDRPQDCGSNPDQPPVEMVVADEEQFQALPATIASARAYLAQAYGDVPGSIQYGRLALTLLPEEDHLRRGIAAAILGVAFWGQGELEAAHETLAAGMGGMVKAGNLLFALRGTYILADIRLAQGRLREAIRIYKEALQQVAEGGLLVQQATADLHLRISELYLEQGLAAAADEHLQRGTALGDDTASPIWQYRRCLAQARVQEAQGDLAGALELLEEAKSRYIRTPVPELYPLAARQARLWLAGGNLTAALDWARERGLSVRDDLSYLQEYEHITLARVLIARYLQDRDESAILDAGELLACLLETAESGGRMGSALEILILQALAFQAQDDIHRALAPLERALALAEPQGYVRVFTAEGPSMALLLSAAAVRGIRPAYTARLLSALTGQEPPPAGPAQRPISAPAQSLIEPLSARELEVLRLLAEGLSNREIGERLFLALSTVKGHNRNIYAKLQVQRRTEAIARARALGLL